MTGFDMTQLSEEDRNLLLEFASRPWSASAALAHWIAACCAKPWFLRPPSEQRIAGNIAAAVNAAVVKFVDRDGLIDGYEVAIGCLSVMSAYIADLPPSVRKEIAANTHTAIDSLFEAGSAAAASEAEDETYEIGKRDGYEQAIQELDIATGGDGEFKGSTIPGATVDVTAMRQRILDRFAAAN